MEIHNPTYNSETNKIVAYLLPKPKKLGNYSKYYEKLKDYKNSRIEIEVDDELREFIENYIGDVWNYDITPIMDRIEVKEIMPKLQSVGQFKKCTYKAKLKQVDKVEESQEKTFNDLIDFGFKIIVMPSPMQKDGTACLFMSPSDYDKYNKKLTKTKTK